MCCQHLLVFNAYLNFLTDAAVRGLRSSAFSSDEQAYYWGSKWISVFPIVHAATSMALIDSVAMVWRLNVPAVIRFLVLAPFFVASLTLISGNARFGAAEDMIRREAREVQAARAKKARTYFIVSWALFFTALAVYAAIGTQV